MVKIKDQESAQAWLETQPHQVQVWFAARCALRALPGAGIFDEQHGANLLLTFLRANLIAAAAATTRELTSSRLQAAAESARLSAFQAEPSTISSDAAAYVASAVSESHDPSNAASYSLVYSADEPIGEPAFAAANEDLQVVQGWPRLWHEAGIPNHLDEWWQYLKQNLAADPETWGFWLEWYEAILNGAPLPWELSFRIATTLTDDDWAAGPAHVALRISGIRQAFDLADAIGDFRRSAKIVTSDSAWMHRGHNDPPELIEEPALVERGTVVWAALDDLEREAKAEAPDKANARKALAILQDWFVAVCGYMGRKVDRAIDKAVDWGVPAGLGYLLLNPEKLQMVISFAERWLRP